MYIRKHCYRIHFVYNSGYPIHLLKEIATMTKLDLLPKLIRLHAENETLPSELERLELAGLLLARDRHLERTDVVYAIFTEANDEMYDYLADYAMSEDEDAKYDLLHFMNKALVNFYSDEIEILIEEAKENFREELKNQNPNNEYNRNDKEGLLYRTPA